MERLLFEDPQSFANTETPMTFPLESPPIIDKRRCISSMFCRFAKEDEPLSEMEHPTHWMLGKYFVINVLFNKVWIMVLPSLMLTFSVEVSLGVKFITKLSLVALGLDIVILEWEIGMG